MKYFQLTNLACFVCKAYTSKTFSVQLKAKLTLTFFFERSKKVPQKKSRL